MLLLNTSHFGDEASVWGVGVGTMTLLLVSARRLEALFANILPKFVKMPSSSEPTFIRSLSISTASGSPPLSTNATEAVVSAGVARAHCAAGAKIESPSIIGSEPNRMRAGCRCGIGQEVWVRTRYGRFGIVDANDLLIIAVAANSVNKRVAWIEIRGANR